ncbi:hypothetical protein [Gynuella sp.]|uniref:hypothetical protein n=1 Tax=Gynuella sp. TaxID=2969146 RepID=UPI003D118276
MIPGLKQLFTPLNYLRIYGNHILRWYNWWMPAFMAIFLILIMGICGWHPSVFNNDGIVTQVTELLKMLIGFYIAALAAVSTFPSAVLNDPISGEPVLLKAERRGKKIEIPLNRRRFLSYLFGYLSFLSIVLFIAGLIASFVHEPLSNIVSQKYHRIWILTGLSVYFFWAFNLLITTLLGLHYLTDRIHRPSDNTINPNTD